MIRYNTTIIQRKLKEFLEEDCSFSDITSKIIPEEAKTTAKIIAKSKGNISGLKELEILYDLLHIEVYFNKEEGEEIKEGDIIAKLKGDAQNILMGERIGLNLVTHMSSITTTTKKFLNIIRDSGKKVKIACTRKTLPGLRIFEKRAVELGGGDPHRFSLDDMVLLKDTHLRFYQGDIAKLLNKMKNEVSFTKKIEIEIEKPEDALIAAKNGADIIMLDNMNPDQVEDTINILKQNNLREMVIIEVSGGINEENLIDYLISEPDVISVGQLTQFPTEKVDISLRFD